MNCDVEVLTGRNVFDQLFHRAPDPVLLVDSKIILLQSVIRVVVDPESGRELDDLFQSPPQKFF